MYNCNYFILLLIFVKLCYGEESNIQIDVPEFICQTDGKVSDLDKDVTIIRILGNNIEDVEYRFNVGYRRIGKQCKNQQRCNLMVWKMIRKFQNYLQNYKLQNGVIEFNNNMLMPGLKYTLNISILKDGYILESNQYDLDVINDNTKDSVNKPLASLLLKGSGTSYSYTTYYLKAEITLCSNISGYYLNWTLLNVDNTLEQIFFHKSPVLTIPPKTFQALQSYQIKCDLINLEDMIPIATKTKDLKILSRGLFVKLPFEILVTRSNEPILINLFVKDLDNNGDEILINWSLDDKIIGDTAELILENGLSEGIYNISLEITKENTSEILTCQVQTIDNVPIIEIDVIQTPISPSQGIEIHARVSQLYSFCTIQWTSLKRDGYSYLDLQTMPGQADQVLNVTAVEDLFLNELDEFKNGTMDKELRFSIPPPEGSWQGLQGDAKYLFRLNVSCPETYEGTEVDKIEYVPNNYTSIHADFTIETNAPPKIGELEISPPEGFALSGLFTFRTREAKDRDEDKPILYKFGYFLEEMEITVCYLLDSFSCTMKLPYSDEGIKTTLEICDNLHSCVKIYGPVIKTSLPDNFDPKSTYPDFLTFLNTEDYYNAFTFTSTILHTYKYMYTDVIVKETNNYFNAEIEQKINELITREDLSEQWLFSSNLLMRYISQFNSNLQLSEKILQDLTLLRNKIQSQLNYKTNSRYIQRKILISQPDVDLSLEDVKNHLRISEIIILNSNDSRKVAREEQYLKNQVISFMERLCGKVLEGNEKVQLEMNTVLFGVERLNLNTKSKFYIVPYERNSWNSISKVRPGLLLFNKLNENQRYCLGKAAFKNNINAKDIIYMVQIINLQLKKSINFDKMNLTVLLPTEPDSNSNSICIQENNTRKSRCKLIKRFPKFVSCSCTTLGQYSLKTFNFSKPQSTKSSETTALPLLTFDDGCTYSYTDNFTQNIVEDNKVNYEMISYLVTFASVIGILIIILLTRRILRREDDDDEENDYLDDLNFPKYATLHDEEMLENEYI